MSDASHKSVLSSPAPCSKKFIDTPPGPGKQLRFMGVFAAFCGVAVASLAAKRNCRCLPQDSNVHSSAPPV
jgi:hypothetical protein